MLPASMLSCLLLVAPPADPLAAYSPEQQLRAWRKMSTSLKDGEPVYLVGEGSVWSRVPGERDRLLFKTLGLFNRTSETLRDPAHPDRVGVRILNREIVLFLDPATNKPLMEWVNPWSKEKLEVVPIANDPVNQPPYWCWTMKDGTKVPFRFLGSIQGPHAIVHLEIPIFRPNEIPAEFVEYGGGGNYHAIELFQFFGSAKNVLDDSQNLDPTIHVAWTRISSWMPWMKMGSRSGQLTMTMHAWRSERIPELLLAYIKEHPEYSAFLTPPPLGDQRPNQTTWSVAAEKLKKATEKK